MTFGWPNQVKLLRKPFILQRFLKLPFSSFSSHSVQLAFSINKNGAQLDSTDMGQARAVHGLKLLYPDEKPSECRPVSCNSLRERHLLRQIRYLSNFTYSYQFYNSWDLKVITISISITFISISPNFDRSNNFFFNVNLSNIASLRRIQGTFSSFHQGWNNGDVSFDSLKWQFTSSWRKPVRWSTMLRVK